MFAVALDDVTVVVMFGPIDLDSRDFQVRLQIQQISSLIGETQSAVIARAIGEYYQHVRAVANPAASPTALRGEFCSVNVRVSSILEANQRSTRGIPFAWAGGMPEISRFYGISIRMFKESGGRHHLPHFHAAYGELSATFSIESAAVLKGYLPTSQRRLVEAWLEIHRSELQENWSLLNSGQSPFKIKPLS